MKVIHTIRELQAELAAYRQAGKKIGFVPTMGALHEGHISLVKQSVEENDVTVISIFVNPTQFNDPNDLLKYPRTLEADCKLLEPAKADLVFVPDVTEMYPEPDSRIFNFGSLERVMEGKFRPGHFNGVAQIVSKLFDAVKADKAYFGEKDYQQLAIIREMVRQLEEGPQIIGCPIIREEDGLAMSSRNARLSEEEHKNALKISQALFKSTNFAVKHTVAETVDFVKREIDNVSGLSLEYFEIVDGTTLQEINDWSDSVDPIGCIAVFCGEVRLIDNIKYK